MHSRIAIFATLLCCAITAVAQVNEQITVQAVDVPVYIFSNGKPVRNLTKDDFELYVNGKLQPIDYFEAVDLAAPAPVAAASPEGKPQAPPALQTPPHAELRDRRLFLLLFDSVFKHPEASGRYAGALDRSRRAALDMVDHSLPSDYFAVAAATTATGGIQFTTPFVRDHAVIRRAILQLTPSSAHDGLALSITPAERGMASNWNTSMQGGGGRAGGESALNDVLAYTASLEYDREINLSNAKIREYGNLAARLRGLEGFKHVILFSDGEPFDPVRESSAVRAMAAAFQSADVSLHTVDLTKMATGADPSVTSASSGAAATRPAENPSALANSGVDWFAAKPSIFGPSENEELFWLANETGGSWIHWKNKITPALAELSASYSAAYRLGFKPDGARKGHNDITVKVKNLPAGARLSFRKGFSTTAPPKGTAVDPLLLADIIQNDTPQSGTPPEISFAGHRVDVIVPVVELSKQFGAIDGARALLYVYDAKGIPVLTTEKTFAIPKNAERDRVIQQNMVLPPGQYVAKVLLRVGDSLAFAELPIEVSQ